MSGQDKFSKTTKVKGNPSIRPKKGAIDAATQKTNSDVPSSKTK